jgi:thiol-disulfide isomerase/thioredoxin
LAVVLVALLGLVAGCTSGAATSVPIRVFAAADRKAAPTLSGEFLGGGTYDPAAFAGKIVVINFWASWCGPCVGEAPELEIVHQAHLHDPVAFLGINVKDELDSARAFAQQHTTFPSIIDESSSLSLGFNVHPNAIPATIILDRQGRVAALAQQALTHTELDDAVTQLLAETS